MTGGKISTQKSLNVLYSVKYKMSIKSKIFIAMKNEIPKKKLHWYIRAHTQKHIHWLYEEKCTVFISDIIKKGKYRINHYLAKRGRQGWESGEGKRN